MDKKRVNFDSKWSLDDALRDNKHSTLIQNYIVNQGQFYEF